VSGLPLLVLGLALLENPDNRTHLSLYAGLLVASQGDHLRNLLFRGCASAENGIPQCDPSPDFIVISLI